MQSSQVEELVGITEFFYNALRSLQPGDVSNWFLYVLIFLFSSGVALAVIKLREKWERLSRLHETLPSHLSAIGVLGTFVGISVGLATFDVNELDDSIPRLLNGLKLAFSTSIVGLGSATLLRVTQSIVVMVRGDTGTGASSAASGIGGITISDDIDLLALRLLNDKLEEGFDHTSEEFSDLKQRMDDLDARIQKYTKTRT